MTAHFPGEVELVLWVQNLPSLFINMVIQVFSTWFCWSHLFHWAWNKGLPWPTPRNWQRGLVMNETIQQERQFQFSHCELSVCSKIQNSTWLGSIYSYLSSLTLSLWESRFKALNHTRANPHYSHANTKIDEL